MNREAHKEHVIIGIPVLFIGGTERQTLTLVSVLLAGGYKVTVCCYYESDPSMVLAIEKAGAHVLLLGLKRNEGLLFLLRRLKTLFKEMLPDIVHVQYIAPGLLPIIAARLAGIKTIFATVHQPGRIYGWKEKLFLRIAARLCTAFFCNSKSVEKSWFGNSEIYNPEKNYTGRKHFTIYNGVDIEHIEKIANSTNRQILRNSLGISNKPVIGVVGRLRWEKGQEVLIDAMPEVVKKIPNVILLVVGDGPDRMGLELRAKSLELENKILWLGQKDPNEVFQLYSIMDVVTIPSRFEGFGLTAAEAMAAGRPVIGMRVDGLTEIIEESVTGYLVTVNNSGELARALIKLLNNPERARTMGLNGAERVKKMFSLEQFSESALAAYRYFTGL